MNAVRQLREPTLAELVHRAVTTSDHLARLDAAASDATFNHWERQSLNARDALLDRLADFGITKVMASKMGGVL